MFLNMQKNTLYYKRVELIGNTLSKSFFNQLLTEENTKSETQACECEGFVKEGSIQNPVQITAVCLVFA